MEINLKKELLNVCELMFENTSEQSVDGDITLPDYCPDIKKILKCIVTPGLVSEQCVGDRVTIEANALVQVIYVDDSNNIFCYDKIFPFSKTVELGKQIDNPVTEVKMKSAYANTRAVSQRRIDVHASIAISINITGKKEIEIITDAENCGIQLLKDFTDASDYVGRIVKNFTLNEVVELEKSKPAVRQIIRQKVNPFVSEIKVVNNKLLLKGDVNISLLYCADVTDGGYVVFEYSLPINQIVEFEGINDKCDYNINVCVSSLNILPKANSNGEKKLLDVNIGVCAVVKAIKSFEGQLPTDCYSTIYNVKNEKQLVTFEKIIDKFSDMLMIKQTEDFPNVTIGEIVNVWCDDVVTTYTCVGDELNVHGSTIVSILGKDDLGQPFYAERTISFEKKKNVDGMHSDYICAFDSVSATVGYVLSDNNKIDLRVEVRFTATLSKRNTAELLKNIICDESEKKSKTCSALTIYFCDNGELLWNIARKYNTTVDLIKLENDIKENSVSEKCMLLIPGV